MPRVFESLLNHPADAALVATRFELTIRKSFEQDRSRVTGSETRRRFAICEKWFRLLRGDKGWGLLRSLDALPHALRGELDGTGWTPDSRALWAPGDGRV